MSTSRKARRHTTETRFGTHAAVPPRNGVQAEPAGPAVRATRTHCSPRSDFICGAEC
jgi:hypothetical protein